MNIVVLAGGISTERDVSLTSGKNILSALKALNENAQLLDLFLGFNGSTEEFWKNENECDTASVIGTVDPSINDIKAIRGDDGDGLFGPNVLKICKSADIVFLALHGEDGENGKVQATFDTLGIKYTGSGCLGSAMAMNKYISKQIMNANGIKNAEYVFVKKGSKIPKINIPCVIKPTSGGSSVGVSIVQNESEFESAIETAFKYEDEIIIEQYIKGREFSVGILGDKVLPPIEIIPKEGFYDYSNKYQPGMTIEICPAELSEDETKRVQTETKKICEALGIEIYGRADFILNEEDNEFYCLEVNSLPGMTQMSLLPQEAAAAGINYPALCKKIIELSLNK